MHDILPITLLDLSIFNTLLLSSSNTKIFHFFQSYKKWKKEF